MATQTIPTDTNGANSAAELYTQGTGAQINGSRIRSLADAIREAADEACTEERQERRRETLNRIIDFADLIEREASTVIERCERIEVISGTMSKAQ